MSETTWINEETKGKRNSFFAPSARWITPEGTADPEIRRPAGYLCRKFIVRSSKDSLHRQKYLLRCTAHGLYKISLNKKSINDYLFEPGVDDYRKRLAVRESDISSLLKEGLNEIDVILGDGWYRGCIGIDSTRNFFGNDLSFIGEITDQDGKILLATDETWQGSQDGPIRMTDLEQGEFYDARMETIRAWHPVRIVEGMEGENAKFYLSHALPVREKESFKGEIIITPNGRTVIDFHQNLAGYVEITADANEGQSIRLVHGETLDLNGNFTTDNFQPGERNKMGIRQEIRYICKEGRNHYRPSFSIFGFRYAELETDIPLENLSFCSHAVYSDMKETTSFHCSEADINQLFSNCMWSMKSNFCDIPTDCPTRERAGWTGDAGIFAPTGLYLMQCAPVLEKWLCNVRLDQFEDGSIPYICPPDGPNGIIARNFRASVGWGDASILVPWAIYEMTGKLYVLRDNYDLMTRWVRFLEKRAKQRRNPDPFDGNPYQDYIINVGMDYGEWGELDTNMENAIKQAVSTGQPEIATAYFSYSSGLLAEISKLLGEERNAEYFENLHMKAREAWRSVYLKNGHIHSDRACSYVRPIAFHLLSQEEERAAADDLVRLIRRQGYTVGTGFLSTPYLCPVLISHGYTDVAYKILLQRKCPGWLYEVSKGATTIWEDWDGIPEKGEVHSSLNHYSKGSVALFLIRDMCGINYRFDRLVIHPRPYPLIASANASFQSPGGWIRSGWNYSDSRKNITYRIEIPKGMSAEVILPEDSDVPGSSESASEDGGCPRILCGGIYEYKYNCPKQKN